MVATGSHLTFAAEHLRDASGEIKQALEVEGKNDAIDGPTVRLVLAMVDSAATYIQAVVDRDD